MKKKGIDKQELSPFEEALIDTIKEWREEGIDPLEDVEIFKEYANELFAVALNPIPCWRKFRNGGPLTFDNGPLTFDNGLLKTPMGTALIHDGSFVMLEDLVERLPRIVDNI